MATVALVPHHLRDQAVDLARDAIAWLEADGHAVRVPAEDAKAVGLTGHAAAEDELTAGLDVAVSLGGDGTMLHTVDLVARAGVPVLGINVGQLGYLTEVEPADLRTALDRFLAGDYEVEERMTLEVEVRRAGGATTTVTHTALNEAVVEKEASGHAVRLRVSIADRLFTTYAADGLLVATPTGSTAYNFSARGPIASPRLRALLVTPISPHMLFDRSLVLDDSEDVRLEVIDGRSAVLVVDGRQLCSLCDGDSIVCRAGPWPARLVTFAARDFHRILKAKFGLSDR